VLLWRASVSCCRFWWELGHEGSYSPLFFLGAKFNITSLIFIGRDMSEVILNLVPRGEKQGSKNLCNTRDQVAKLFTGRKFLTCACKVLTFNLYQSNTSLLKCKGHCELYNIHRILVFMRGEGGET
jgi:hypothetical protein